MNDKELWIEVCFNGEPVDNVIAGSKEEAIMIIKSIEEGGWVGYNDDIKNWWLDLGLESSPKVTAHLTRS